MSDLFPETRKVKYVVSQARGKYPVTWLEVSRHDDLTEAEKRAIAFCESKTLYTEPSADLERAFFGDGRRDTWRAKIETEAAE